VQGAPAVLLICGSLGSRSANRSALMVVEAALVAAGATVTTDDSLGQIPPLDPELVDAAGDAVDGLRRAIAASDAVIIAAPEYAGSLAGAVKNALDWVVGSGELDGKPVGIVSAGTTGGPFARQVLARTLLWQGAQLVAQLGISAPRTKSAPDGTISESATLEALRTFAGAVLASLAAEPDARSAASARIAASVGVRRHGDGGDVLPFATFG
jgi:NAD(P)H-dependent FMN reductase